MLADSKFYEAATSGRHDLKDKFMEISAEPLHLATTHPQNNAFSILSSKTYMSSSHEINKLEKGIPENLIP